MTVVLVMLFATPLLEGSFIDRISVENQGTLPGMVVTPSDYRYSLVVSARNSPPPSL